MQEHKGNLLEGVKRGIIVHGCNCLGVMGAGFAAAVRNMYPDVEHAYVQHHRQVGLFLGDVVTVAGKGLNSAELPRAVNRHVHLRSEQLPEDLFVVNAMTQEKVGRDPDVRYVDYDALSAAFVRVRMLARDTGLPVHFPLIGCGLANGKWEDVAPRIGAALGRGIEAHLWTL